MWFSLNILTSFITNEYRPSLPKPEFVTLPSNKTALVIVDMQNDFSHPEGSIFIGNMIGHTIPKIKYLLDKSRTEGLKILHTQSWHPEDAPRYMDPPVPRASFGSNGCKVNTWGADIIKELKPLKGEPIIQKDTFDPWFGTKMEQILVSNNFGEFEHDSAQRNRLRHESYVIITGTASDVCVDKAVIGFFFRGYKVIIPIDCISTYDQFCQESAIYRFVNYFDAIITKSEMIQFVPETTQGK